MGKTLTEPAATPYAEALLLCDNKQVEEDLLKIIELLDTMYIIRLCNFRYDMLYT